MSRIIEFCDGAERGDLSYWTSQPGGNSGVTTGIHGAYCYVISSPGVTAQTASKTITTGLSEFYFRCYVKPITGFNMAFRNSTTSLLTFAHNTTDSRLNITGGATGNTGNNSMIAGTWYCLEVYYKISDTVGVVTVKIDGVQVFTFSGDTKPGADTTVNNFIFYVTLSSFNLDDLALDTAAWCGLGYYVALTANAAGDVTQWTPTGGANYANVGIPANDSTFNTGTTGQLDNYAMTSTTLSGATILRVIPWARLKNSAGGTANVGLKTNGTDYTAAVTTPTSFAWLAGSEYINNPQSGNSWLQAELDALQFTVSVP